MSRNHQKKIRDRKYAEQGHLCYYCDHPMWTGCPSAFQRQHGISLRKVHHYQLTAEHLLPASQGGQVTHENIVAACKFCNSTRAKSKHTLPPDAYKVKVRKRLAQGRWL
ncbi:HNH endonuclease [Yoonia sp.]|uniref:HNH endonuclease n=1 Tax=Yoonia sp. TaxID=2212373 RepID=UPI003FCD0511